MDQAHLIDDPLVSTSLFLIKKIFFLMWTIFKVFIETVTILLLFYVLVFLAKRHVGSLLSRQGWNLHPLCWKAEF